MGQSGGGGGWEAKGRLRLPLKTQTAVATVCPVSGTSSHNPWDRPRRSLAAV